MKFKENVFNLHFSCYFMLIKEVEFEPTDEGKRMAIRSNLGKQVILNDEHNGWCHGFLKDEGWDSAVYQIQIEDGRKEGQFQYHNLSQLLIAIDR